MSRVKLREGGRPKKFIGGLISGGATIAAAAIQAAATAAAAKTQSQAMMENARTQAKSIAAQTENNNQLQTESLAFTRQQNAENRQQQRDIQMTLQRLAGQANANDRMEAQKVQVKYGGRPKRRKLKSQPSYGGGDMPFRVTDGGGVIPIQVDPYGYGLYELYGNDHEHYHKAPGGKNKRGVGIKFNDGSIVEGEGNQNSNQGELLYVTPNDAMFISKHSINGFNPAKAVEAGVNPVEAFDYQEYLKAINGVTDDGTKAKCGKRKSIKRLYGGYNPVDNFSNITQLPSNGTAPIAAGTIYMVNPSYAISPAERYGKMKLGGRIKAITGFGFNPKVSYIGDAPYDYIPSYTPNKSTNKGFNFTNNTSSNFWNDYGGATLNAAGQFGGALIGSIGNAIASGIQRRAIKQATDAYINKINELHGIDMSEVKREDFAAPHAMAVIRDPNTNINPQLAHIDRNVATAIRETNRSTMSSAARQLRNAAAIDKGMQDKTERYAYKHNNDEQIKQQSTQLLTEVIDANANRDAQARQNYANTYLNSLKYNTEVDNSKIAAIAQANSDSLIQSAAVKANSLQSSMGLFGNALGQSAAGFASTFDGLRQEQRDINYLLTGMDTDNQIQYLIQNVDGRGNRLRAMRLYNQYKDSGNATLERYANRLKVAYGFV